MLPAVDYPQVPPRDPFADAPPLPERRALMQRRRAVTLEAPPPPAVGPSDLSGSVRTAMTVEPRDGRLCVFMPPVEDAEDYAALVAVIEETARTTGVPVLVEGYTPPPDPRINVIKVTPGPGCHRGQHPSGAQLGRGRLPSRPRFTRRRTSPASAPRSSCSTGATPAPAAAITSCSAATRRPTVPFLRRPDLLASHHRLLAEPSLAVLPVLRPVHRADQPGAPRRRGVATSLLYELEIALASIPDPGAGYVPPWLVDRLFRNLLIDVTGNTHRAEICIDKLYSPDGPTGRLGLVEFRSFEMPPHAHMSLAQQLLIRALVAMFWEKPYRQGLVRWGSALHDRFMLPHYLWADFASIIADLQRAKLPVELAWFEPHLEFRCPRLGVINAGDVEIELRQALEPWHVLGEEGVVGGTARYVDSSLERVQVRARGLTGDRFVVACNGRSLPLAPTGTFGEAVAGVRYRAWGPPSALHPNIPPHVPLTLRPGRHLVGPLHRRLPLPRLASGRAQLRDLPDQRLRGRGTPARPVRGQWAHRRPDGADADRRQPGISCDPRSPPARRLRHQRKPRGCEPFRPDPPLSDSTGMIDVGVHSRNVSKRSCVAAILPCTSACGGR